jgi:NADH dehydrogenase [ubiquinone] 1 alpha subcomplex assembly factor 7
MTVLKDQILRLIRTHGPISVAQYMQMALTDPTHGYYMRRDPFGRGGDFITAPEVSQIFGELIGLAFAQAWEDRGRPERFCFVELGPGRGTLMSDALRAAAKVRPDFVAGARVVLVEASPALRTLQAKTLSHRQVEWTNGFSAVPDDAPLFLVANEFFDALPVRQFVRTMTERRLHWHERMVAERNGELVFALAPDPVPLEIVLEAMPPSPLGDVYEVQEGALAIAGEIAARIAARGGAALIIDYGPSQPGLGDTLQAVKAHAFADPLAEPGETDLTCQVDFAALAQAAQEQEAQIFGPVPQGAFLESLGIRLRGTMLKRAAPTQANEIDAGIDRLIGRAHMGTLFKVLGFAQLGTPDLPGFSC